MITFRLADSLPRKVILRILSTVDDDEVEKKRRFEEMLDNGYGSCVLKRERCAQIVIGALQYHDKERYRLLEWVVMPNHVHVVYDRPKVAMETIIKTWKGYSSRMIRRYLGLTGDEKPLWQAGFHDRYARSEQHLMRMKAYVHFNPVKAGLVDDPLDWPYSSIHD